MNLAEVDEFALLSSCAFRFRGLDYLKDHPEFNPGEALTRLTQWGEWPPTHEERLALFFLLRFCGSEPRHGRNWQVFRELFLELCRAEIPPEYASAPHCEEWDHFYRGQLDAWVTAERQIHSSTEYPQVLAGRVSS